MLQLAGLEDQIIYFVLEDYQIICDTMFDYVNSLLASGEVRKLHVEIQRTRLIVIYSSETIVL